MSAAKRKGKIHDWDLLNEQETALVYTCLRSVRAPKSSAVESYRDTMHAARSTKRRARAPIMAIKHITFEKDNVVLAVKTGSLGTVSIKVAKGLPTSFESHKYRLLLSERLVASA